MHLICFSPPALPWRHLGSPWGSSCSMALQGTDFALLLTGAPRWPLQQDHCWPPDPSPSPWPRVPVGLSSCYSSPQPLSKQEGGLTWCSHPRSLCWIQALHPTFPITHNSTRSCSYSISRSYLVCLSYRPIVTLSGAEAEHPRLETASGKGERGDKATGFHWL